MKQNILYLLLAPFLLYSCQKEIGQNTDELPGDDGCIERTYTPVTAHNISSANIATADSLLDAYNIDRSNLRYTRYDHDSVQTFYPPYAKFDSKIVVADQYFKGVWVFGKDILYHFKNNVHDFTNGTITNGTTLDTSVNLNLKQLRKLFMDDMLLYNHCTNYSDSCFTAEFGFYNVKSGSNNQDETLVKAWRLALKGSTPSFNRGYPLAYYRDSDGKRIWYFDCRVASTFP